jgi:hypothetical protein
LLREAAKSKQESCTRYQNLTSPPAVWPEAVGIEARYQIPELDFPLPCGQRRSVK